MRYTNLQQGEDSEGEEIELVHGGASSSSGQHQANGWQDAKANEGGYQHVDNVLEQSYVTAQRQQDWYERGVVYTVPTRWCPHTRPNNNNLLQPCTGNRNGHFTSAATQLYFSTGYP